MTALVKKDLYLVGKQTWLMLGIALLFSLTKQFSGFGSAYLMVLTLTLPLTTLAYDERCRWDTYLAMTPCRPAVVVLSKYLFAFLMAAAATSVTLLADLARTLVTREAYSFAGGLVERFALLAVILTVNSITLPVIFRFGVEKGRLTMMGMMFSLFAIIVGGAKVIGEEKMFGWMDRIPVPALGAAALLFVILVNIASFCLAVRFYQRRRAGAYD